MHTYHWVLKCETKHYKHYFFLTEVKEKGKEGVSLMPPAITSHENYHYTIGIFRCEAMRITAWEQPHDMLLWEGGKIGNYSTCPVYFHNASQITENLSQVSHSLGRIQVPTDPKHLPFKADLLLFSSGLFKTHPNTMVPGKSAEPFQRTSDKGWLSEPIFLVWFMESNQESLNLVI